MKPTRWNIATNTKDARRQRKRQAVLIAGAQLFNERGYDGTSLEDIAKLLNVSKRSIYNYFQSKDEILFECYRMGLEFVETSIKNCLDRSIPVLDRIATLVADYAEISNTDMGACLVQTNEQVLSDDRRAEIRQLKAKLDRLVRQLIQEGIEDGSIRECDPQLATAAIFGAINWIPMWYHKDGSIDFNRVKSEFTDFVIAALQRQA